MGWKNSVDNKISKLPKEKLRQCRTFPHTEGFCNSPIKPHQNGTFDGKLKLPFIALSLRLATLVNFKLMGNCKPTVYVKICLDVSKI